MIPLVGALQGDTQGPCSRTQFRHWLRTMSGNPKLRTELEQFQSVTVWRVRWRARHVA
jgi:hypothetical protein